MAGYDPSIYSQVRPPDFSRSLLTGMEMASGLQRKQLMAEELKGAQLRNRLTADEAQRQANVRNVLTGEGIGSPTVLQHVAEQSPETAVSMAPMIQSAQQEQVGMELRKHQLYHDALGRVKAQLADWRTQNPDATPADEEKFVTQAWQPERYMLEKAIPATPPGLRAAPAAPIFMGGRGFFKEDIEPTLTTQGLLSDFDTSDKILRSYGTMATVVNKQGQAKSVIGTPQQQLEAAGEGGQVLKQSEKPVGVLTADEARKHVFDLGTKVYDETKPFREGRQSYAEIRTLAQDNTGQSDAALVDSFTRLVTGLGARENQVQIAMNTGGLSDTLTNYLKRAQTGEKFNDKMRAGFVKAAQGIYEQGKATHEEQLQGFRQTGQALGLNEGQIEAALSRVPARKDLDEPWKPKKPAVGGETPDVNLLPKGRENAQPGEAYTAPDGSVRIRGKG